MENPLQYGKPYLKNKGLILGDKNFLFLRGKTSK